MSAPVVAEADPRDAIIEHIPAMRAFAMSLARNHAAADDLVQDTIVKAWTRFGSFTPGTNLRAWLFTILRNTFFSERRKAGREVSDPDGIHAGALSEKPAHDGRLAMGEFLRAFHTLSDEHREVLVLVGANGYSYEEAAEMIGVAKGTVKSRASRARMRLGELLGLVEANGDRPDPDGERLSAVMRSGLTAA